MGSRSWIARVLTASVPFVVIVTAFAAAVAWHMSAPGRQAARFHRLLDDDQPVAHDYGDDALVTMERLGCRDACPSYSVRIHGSGEIEFEGSAFVCVKHPLGDRVLRVTAQRLIDAMARIDFDKLRRPPRAAAANASITVTSLRIGGAGHGIEDDGASDMPPVVGEIERQIDRVAGTARWKRIPRNDGEHVPFCPGPDGSKHVFDADGQLVPEDAAGAVPPPSTAPSTARAVPGAGRAQAFERILAGDGPPPIAFPDGAFVALRRTACYGTCPIYTVQVFGSGRVEFKGERFVCDENPAAVQVDRVAAQRLLNALAGAGFASLHDFDREDATDAPSANLELSDGKTSHKISHYLGMLDVPPELALFEQSVDRLAGVDRWLPSGDPRACRRADGTRDRFTRDGTRQPLPSP